MRRLRLIIIDGLDGVGKDTHAQLIKERYEKRGERVVVRSHPEADTFCGRTAKKALLNQGKINQLKASVFYALDVLSSLRRYYRRPQGDTLIMVRYLMGTAYLPERLAPVGYHFFERLVPTSEYMFFLDATPAKLVQRIAMRREVEMFESLESLVKVRRKMLGLAKGWHVVDTDQSVEQTAADIAKILDDLDRSRPS